MIVKAINTNYSGNLQPEEQARLNFSRKNVLRCHSERSEESLLGFRLNKREIPRFARNDNSFIFVQAVIVGLLCGVPHAFRRVRGAAEWVV